MENKSDSVTNWRIIQSSLVVMTLRSWRFLLLFSFPPLVWVIVLATPGPLRAAIGLLCGVVWFGCWRVWLDERYLALIAPENHQQAGEALAFIWGKEKLASKTLEERQQGALRLLRKTLSCTAVLWLFWLTALLFW